jgi:hypothetical protein
MGKLFYIIIIQIGREEWMWFRRSTKDNRTIEYSSSIFESYNDIFKCVKKKEKELGCIAYKEASFGLMEKI